MVDCAGGALPDLIAIAGDPARVVTIADFAAAAHGVHMSHGAPADETGAAVGAPADPVAVHGLGIAVTLAGRGPAAGAGRGGVPAGRGRCRARTERKPPRPRKDRAGALIGLRPRWVAALRGGQRVQ